MDQVAQPELGVDVAADWSAGVELVASIVAPYMMWESTTAGKNQETEIESNCLNITCVRGGGGGGRGRGVWIDPEQAQKYFATLPGCRANKMGTLNSINERLR